MDKAESRCLGISTARTEPVNCSSKDGKSVAVHSKYRGAKERHKLDEDLNSLMKIIHEKEASLKERMNDGDVLLGRLKDIRREKEATISRRKVIDDDLRALNNEKTGETFIKLRGSLQYRTEKALNEAISRLELQLTTHNYRVSEEKKIVQEIDRLKRSKKILREYLSLEEELNQMKTKQRMMRLQRDGLYRQVTLLKADEDEIKKSSLENRTQIDQLKKDLDELHSQKRKAMSDLKQAVQPMLHLKELQQKKIHNLRKRECCTGFQQNCLREFRSSTQDFLYCKKERNEGKFTDALFDKQTLCNTLMAYLHRMTVSPTSTPSTPVVEQDSKVGTSPVAEIQDGDMVLVLRKRSDEDDAFLCQKSWRAPKKGKRDRKRIQQNRLLCHTPDMLDQFYKLDISPPSSLNDVLSCLEALATKKQQLQHGSEHVTSKLSPESRLPSIAECVGKIDINFGNRCDLDGNESVCRHGDSVTVADLEPGCDTHTWNSTACMHHNELVSNDQLVYTQQLPEEHLPPCFEVRMEDSQSASRVMLGHLDCSTPNGRTDLQHIVQNRVENVEIFSGKLGAFSETDSDNNENMGNGDEKHTAVERMDHSEQRLINFDMCSIPSNDKVGLHKSDFTMANLNCSGSCNDDIKFLDPDQELLFTKAQPDCYIAIGVCNGDLPISQICNEIKLDENLNSDQGSENGIAYSV